MPAEHLIHGLDGGITVKTLIMYASQALKTQIRIRNQNDNEKFVCQPNAYNTIF